MDEKSNILSNERFLFTEFKEYFYQILKTLVDNNSKDLKYMTKDENYKCIYK